MDNSEEVLEEQIRIYQKTPEPIGMNFVTELEERRVRLFGKLTDNSDSLVRSSNARTHTQPFTQGRYGKVNSGRWEPGSYSDRIFVPTDCDTTVISERTASCGKYFTIWARNIGGNVGNTVSATFNEPDAERIYVENYRFVKSMRTKEVNGDCTFAYCVKWVALAYPGEVEQRIAQTFGPYTWALAYPYYLETVMALLPLDLPAYIVLWMLDWFDKFRVAPEIRKVQFVEALRQSRRAILARREARTVEQRTN